MSRCLTLFSKGRTLAWPDLGIFPMTDRRLYCLRRHRCAVPWTASVHVKICRLPPSFRILLEEPVVAKLRTCDPVAWYKRSLVPMHKIHDADLLTRGMSPWLAPLRVAETYERVRQVECMYIRSQTALADDEIAKLGVNLTHPSRSDLA